MKITIIVAIAALAGSCTLPCPAAPKPTSKTPQELEKEVVALRETLKQQEETLQYQRETILGVGDNAVMAPFGRFLLVKDGSQCLALRVTEHVNFRIVKNTQQYTAKYEWFLQSDGSMNFSKANVQQGSGEVSEIKDGAYAAAYIKAGSFPQLEWSLSDWIYFTVGGTPAGGNPPGSQQDLREKNMRMARTEWIRIQDVNPQSRTLEWLFYKQAKESQEDTALVNNHVMP